MEHAVLRIYERCVHLSGNPRGGAKAEIKVSRLCHTRTNIGAGTVAAADGHGNTRAKAEAACRFLTESACDLAAGMNLREFVQIKAYITEHIRIILPRFQIHEQAVRRIRHVGRFHLAGKAVDKIVLRLQDAVCPGVEFWLVFL